MILRFRMGSHHLPIEEGHHVHQPQASRVCNLCNTGASGDARHMLLEYPALAGLRLAFYLFLLSCSGVMSQLLRAKDQHEVCKYIIVCRDKMSLHQLDCRTQMLFHSISLLPGMRIVLLFTPEEEEERLTHPWQPTRLIGWNNIWVEQCHLLSIVRCCFRIRDPMT